VEEVLNRDGRATLCRNHAGAFKLPARLELEFRPLGRIFGCTRYDCKV
jgi:hypothetical protein